MADHFGWLLSQVSHIENQVYRTKYPDIQYHRLVPVDRSAPEWIRSVTHFSSDKVGRAEPLAGRADDVPLVDITHQKHEISVEMAAIGYDYTEEELEQARMIRGMRLKADKADAARRSAEEYIDAKVLYGDPKYGWDGLISPPNAGTYTPEASGTGDTTAEKKLWANKSASQKLRDVNNLLLGVYTETNTVEMADTIAFPPTIWTEIISSYISGTDTSVAKLIREENVYTHMTGRKLNIVQIRGLEKPTSTSDMQRVLAYRKDRNVIRLHLPMPFRFRPVERRFMRYIIPGIFRMGGVEVRRPKAFRIMDGFAATPAGYKRPV